MSKTKQIWNVIITILMVFIMWLFLFPLEVFALFDAFFQWIAPQEAKNDTANATANADLDVEQAMDLGQNAERTTKIVQTILSVLWFIVFIIFAWILVNALLYANTNPARTDMLETIRAVASLLFIVFLIRKLVKDTYTEFQFYILHTDVKTLKHNIYDSTSLMTRAASMMYLYTLFYIKFIWFLFLIYFILHLFKYFTEAHLMSLGLEMGHAINRYVRTALDVDTWFASLMPSKLKIHAVVYIIGLVSMAVYSIIFLKHSSVMCARNKSKMNEIATANRATYGFAMVYSMMSYYYLILAMLILFDGFFIKGYKWGMFNFSKAPV